MRALYHKRPDLSRLAGSRSRRAKVKTSDAAGLPEIDLASMPVLRPSRCRREAAVLPAYSLHGFSMVLVHVAHDPVLAFAQSGGTGAPPARRHSGHRYLPKCPCQPPYGALHDDPEKLKNP